MEREIGMNRVYGKNTFLKLAKQLGQELQDLQAEMLKIASEMVPDQENLPFEDSDGSKVVFYGVFERWLRDYEIKRSDIILEYINRDRFFNAATISQTENVKTPSDILGPLEEYRNTLEHLVPYDERLEENQFSPMDYIRLEGKTFRLLAGEWSVLENGGWKECESPKGAGLLFSLRENSSQN